MVDQKVCIDVGVEPFVLRSALGACLEQDPRLDVAVLPPNCDNDTVGSIMVPEPRRVADVTLTAVEDCPPQVEIRFGDTYRRLPYDGMAGFAAALFDAISGTLSESSALAFADGGVR